MAKIVTRKKFVGNWCIALILLFLAVIPGIIYIVVKTQTITEEQ